MSAPCLMTAWSACQAELLGYLRHRVGHLEDAEEVLQEVFIKAMRQGTQFCGIDNPRAWLFQVTRNALADRLRLARAHVSLPEDLAAPSPEAPPPVDDLSQCLPRVLAELSETDRQAITFCDIDGKSQQELAESLGLSLSGAKSRIQRARQHLREKMESACQVRFDESGSICCFTPRPPLPDQ
ncbi:RNA polymerase sigma factor SigZ [Azonexus sp. IMCC34842]|uniref:RNA polymerase sigma factor SigZ n=1 Tax=Azonexus sp. IMCC34842 TaxID=3420950 RepID=UPI003D147764